MPGKIPERPKRQADYWYCLATLYGFAGGDSEGLEAQNRVAWNRYMAVCLTEEKRAALIAEGRYPKAELSPLSDEEMAGIAEAFEKRTGGEKLWPYSPLEINFKRVEFDQGFRVIGYLFPVMTLFSGASFASYARFSGATFVDHTDFRDTIFSKGALFDDADFASWVAFNGANFNGNTSFNSAIFSSVTAFDDATFAGPVAFERAVFGDVGRQRSVTRARGVSFRGVTFRETAGFSDTTFADPVDFSRAIFFRDVSYRNAEMKTTTSFSLSKFKTEPPGFYNAKLHQDTDWHGIEWPPAPAVAEKAVSFIRAYECLKLEMDRLKKHEDELDFFARELKSRGVLAGRIRGLPIVLYGFLCDYGRSYVRPLLGLLMTVIIGAVSFFPHFLKDGLAIQKSFGLSIGLSLANTFGLFGFRKDFVANEVINGLPNLLTAVAAIQTALGAALLFLFGLALRNRFRMR